VFLQGKFRVLQLGEAQVVHHLGASFRTGEGLMVRITALAPPLHDGFYFIAHLPNAESIRVLEAKLLVKMRREAVLLIDKLLRLVDVNAADVRFCYSVLLVVWVWQLVDAPSNCPDVTLDGASLLLVLLSARSQCGQRGLRLVVRVEVLLGPIAREECFRLHLLRSVFHAAKVFSVITSLELFVGTEIVGVVCSQGSLVDGPCSVREDGCHLWIGLVHSEMLGNVDHAAQDLIALSVVEAGAGVRFQSAIQMRISH